MKSYDYRLLCEEVKRMQQWQCTALCAVCAEKVAPIVSTLGLPRTWDLVEQCLAFVWSSTPQVTNIEEGLNLTKALESTPEWGCDDASKLAYIVGNALNFVRFALWAATAVSPSKQAERALSLLPEV